LLLLLGIAFARGAIRVGSEEVRMENGQALSTRPLVVVQANVAQSLKHSKELEAAETVFDRHLALTKAELDRLVDRRQDPLAVLPFLRKGRDLVSVIPEITAGDEDQRPFVLEDALPPARPGGANRRVLAGTVICFEIAFPARCRAWRRAGATVLLNAGNYGWFGDTGMPAQVLAMAKLRAAELNVTFVVAGNTGPTAIVDPAGRVRAQVARSADGKTQ